MKLGGNALREGWLADERISLISMTWLRLVTSRDSCTDLDFEY